MSGTGRRPDVSGERHPKGAGTKEGIVEYMILLYGSQRDYDVMAGKAADYPALSPEDFAPMYELMASNHRGPDESGELVDARGLAPPPSTPEGSGCRTGFPS
jgi:hypothetical protein